MRPIPFKAAIFDLDGTLLDSMYVWKRVDERFFAKRGMAIPEAYSREIAGMSYIETAEHTISHYTPGEDPRAIIREWTDLAVDEYAHHVPLKPGALEYLRALKRAGVKLAVATAMTPELYQPCLENLCIADLFDAVCSTEHTGGRGKQCGEVYRYTAEQLGVPAEDCAVFEDVPAGIRGAKAAGMRAYCVRDEHSRPDFPALEAESDFMMDSLLEMQRVHDLPERRRCVIFTAYMQGDPKDFYRPEPGDFVLCADGGWKHARGCGVTPDLILGDFDSSEKPDARNVETFPCLKDDTDTMLCVRRALALGFEGILILGGMGGRLDHTFANLQSMQFAALRHARVKMEDGNCVVYAVRGGSVTVPRRKGKISLFSLTEVCRGVSAKGTLYELEDGTLESGFPLGVSNEFRADEAVIGVKEGTLLVMCCHD